MITTDGPAPYAPLSAVLAVVHRHRGVGLVQIDVPTLQRIGISESLAPRTLQALRILDLIDDHGAPSDSFERLRKAPTSDYPAVLAEVVRQAYGPVFAVVDPTTASLEAIEDAFRHFVPTGQRARMVTLFTGLLAESGLTADPLKKRPGPPSTPTARRSKHVVVPSNLRVGPQSVPSANELSPSLVSSRGDNGDTYRVSLGSGGSVAVVVDVNLFELSIEDRSFVIDIVDRLTGYGAKTKNLNHPEPHVSG